MITNTILNNKYLPSRNVLAGGVIDAKALVASLNNRFPAPAEEEPIDEDPVDEDPVDEDPWSFDQPDEDPVDEPSDDQPADDQPTDDQPTDDQPIVDRPAPAPTFGFANLSSGDQAGWPQQIAVKGVPAGTHAVYLYWGYSLWSFSTIYTNGDVEGTLKDSDKWYLYGDRSLKAIAVDANYKVLGYTSLELNGW